MTLQSRLRYLRSATSIPLLNLPQHYTSDKSSFTDQETIIVHSSTHSPAPPVPSTSPRRFVRTLFRPTTYATSHPSVYSTDGEETEGIPAGRMSVAYPTPAAIRVVDKQREWSESERLRLGPMQQISIRR